MNFVCPHCGTEYPDQDTCDRPFCLIEQEREEQDRLADDQVTESRDETFMAAEHYDLTTAIIVVMFLIIIFTWIVSGSQPKDFSIQGESAATTMVDGCSMDFRKTSKRVGVPPSPLSEAAAPILYSNYIHGLDR